LDSRQRFVLILSVTLMVPFVFLTSINASNFGIYLSSYTFVYFALRIVYSPKLKLKLDILGLFLLLAIALLVAQRILEVR